MNRSAKGLLIVTTTSNGFSLANCRQFAKFAKLFTHQKFPLYNNSQNYAGMLGLGLMRYHFCKDENSIVTQIKHK